MFYGYFKIEWSGLKPQTSLQDTPYTEKHINFKEKYKSRTQSQSYKLLKNTKCISNIILVVPILNLNDQYLARDSSIFLI